MAVIFDPNALYGIKELGEMLHGTVELSTFIERLGLRENRVFRDAVWGWEIIEASHRAESFAVANQPTQEHIRALMAPSRKPRPGSKSPVRKLGAADLEDDNKH